MSTYTSFAIVGAGGIGGAAADELLKNGHKVTILTRDDAKPELQELKNRGAVLAKVDYQDQESLKKALTGSQVVISAVSPFAMDAQLPVVPAAKAAGVELFVPAEYGVYVTEGLNGFKKQVQDALKAADLPYTIFYTGLFYSYAPYTLGIDFDKASIRVVGDGKTKFSLVSREEAGHFVGHVVSTAPKAALQWAKIPLEGDRLSGLEVAALVEKKAGKKVTIDFVDYEENKKSYLTDFNAFLNTLFADGRGVPGTEEEVAAAKAKFFPEWKPTSYAEFLA